MRKTGVARPIDHLGRVVIPIELRRSLIINDGDHLEFSVDGDNIILSPYRSQCVFCGKKETQDEFLIEKNDIMCCSECAKELAKRV